MHFTYEKIWKNRFHLSMDGSFWAPYTTWPGGYEHHIVFLVPYKGNTEKIISLQKKLEKTGGFIPFPKEYFHITLKGAGLYATQEEAYQVAKRYRKNKLDLNETIQPFLSQYKGISFFNNVVFLQCFDNGEFKKLHRRITEHYKLEMKPQRDGDSFIPHIAIGTYTNNQHKEALFYIAEKYRNYEFGIQKIDRYHICDVTRLSKEKYPQINNIQEFRFLI